MADDTAEQITGLYGAWSRSLVGSAMLWTGGDHGEAEDVVDEAFHELYRQWKLVATYSESGRYGWLRNVTRNLAVSAYRKRHRISVVDPGDGDKLDQPAPADDQDDPVYALLAREHETLARDLLDRCMSAIQAMPDHLRVAILLRGDGYTSPQIGAQMGVDSSTVRGYWRQAIKELTTNVGDVIKILEEMDGYDQDGEDEV